MLLFIYLFIHLFIYFCFLPFLRQFLLLMLLLLFYFILFYLFLFFSLVLIFRFCFLLYFSLQKIFIPFFFKGTLRDMYACSYVSVLVSSCIYATFPPRIGCDTRSILKRITIGLNSNLSAQLFTHN